MEAVAKTQQEIMEAIGSADAKSIIESLEHLSSAILCNVCRCTPVTPMMCPLCSKICCFSCLKRWYSSANINSCPHCLDITILESYVPCPWIQHVTQLGRYSAPILFPHRELNSTDGTSDPTYPPSAEALVKQVALQLNDPSINTLQHDEKINCIQTLLTCISKIGGPLIDNAAKGLLKGIEYSVEKMRTGS